METLLRPAKQLAEWDSSFAANLENYFNLLKKSQSVNFGEAALVLQNSANVYVRRIEYLWDETEALNQSLSIQNKELGAEEATEKGKKSRKSKGVIDFNDFESLKLHDLVGKSNNLKNGTQKSLKLLTRRFTQLETNLAQLSSPIEILSAQGEVIGNKYDFRCNQQLTKNCMLVDELTPNDFSTASGATTPSHETSGRTISALIQDSGFDSLFDPNHLGSSPRSIASEDMNTELNTPADRNSDKSSNIPDENDAGYTSEDPSEPLATRTPTTEPSSTTPAETSATEPQSNVTEEQPIPPSDNIDKEVLEPIPFEGGVPNTLPRRRTAFKLPCHLSLLKTKSEARKRKRMSESKKRENLTRFLLDKYDLVHKKLKTYSPTRQLMNPLKLEELEEFQKTLDEYLKSMRGSDSQNYDAITRGITMELLGFQPNFTKHLSLSDSHTYEAEKTITDSTMILDAESDLSSVPESFTTPPPTPEAANQRLTYRELVEQRMRQIGEESREQSDLEQRVAEWHKSLRPKLTAAGRRPPFHIHDYGSKIIKTLEVAESKKVPFINLVKHEPASEVARYFLASLQLANSYNVAINTSGESGCGIEVELLAKERQHKPIGFHEKIERISRLSTT